MRTLAFDRDVFEEGSGWLFRRIMNLSLPGLLLAALEMALINAGVLRADTFSPALLKLIGLVTVFYIIPSVFVFPTAWFLSAGRTRLYRLSSIDLYKKKIVYHQVASLIMSRARYIDYSVTQLRRVEKKRGCYILHGTVTNETSGGNTDTLKIPVAFGDMELIEEKARYR